MRRPRLLLLALLAGLVLVVVVAFSHPSVGGVRCPDPVWSSALDGLAEQAPEPCAAQALDRFYVASAGVMGLVLIFGLLSRRGD